MPTLDWLNRDAAFKIAADVPYRLLEHVSTHVANNAPTPDATALSPQRPPGGALSNKNDPDRQDLFSALEAPPAGRSSIKADSDENLSDVGEAGAHVAPPALEPTSQPVSVAPRTRRRNVSPSLYWHPRQPSPAKRLCADSCDSCIAERRTSARGQRRFAHDVRRIGAPRLNQTRCRKSHVQTNPLRCDAEMRAI